MARFGTKGTKRFSARTQVFPGKNGPRIGFVTPGIPRTKFRGARIRQIPTRSTALSKQVKP